MIRHFYTTTAVLTAVMCMAFLVNATPWPTQNAAVTHLVAARPMTSSVSCESAQPRGVRFVYGPGGGPTECFGGTGIESIGQYVQGIATTGHSGNVFVEQADQCVAVPFGPNSFLRLDATVCAIDIASEH